MTSLNDTHDAAIRQSFEDQDEDATGFHTLWHQAQRKAGSANTARHGPSAFGWVLLAATTVLVFSVTTHLWRSGAESDQISQQLLIAELTASTSWQSPSDKTLNGVPTLLGMSSPNLHWKISNKKFKEIE